MTAALPAEYRCWSWAIVNGGPACARQVAWLFLEPDEIADVPDVAAWYRQRLAGEGLAQAVGLLTSRRRHEYVECGDEVCHVVATVGLSNALAAGDPASPHTPGTINILCALESNLTGEAALEAMALAAEARTAAMMEAQVPSTASGRIATGTGTDCIVLAHATEGEPAAYCGKHTMLGHRIGHHVREAVSRGIADWLREFAR
jgi:adenosylcobinamide amidohydrolase